MGKQDVGITVGKKDDFSEWYTQVVLKAKLADYAPVKGLIVLRPDGYSIWESLRSTFDKKFARNGIRNGFLPILIPESLLGKEQKHFAGFNPEVFWVTHSGTNEIGDRLALRPTSETLAYTLYSKWIQHFIDNFGIENIKVITLEGLRLKRQNHFSEHQNSYGKKDIQCIQLKKKQKFDFYEAIHYLQKYSRRRISYSSNNRKEK